MTAEKPEQKNNDTQNSQQNVGELDAAGKSLADALKISFNILKFIMIALVIFFVTSGIFTVQENEQGMVLRFGKIRGIGDDRILGPGAHWDWPEPISEIVTIVVTTELDLPIESFWYSESKEVKLGTRKYDAPDKLDPKKDGYCLTRNEAIIGTDGAD